MHLLSMKSYRYALLGCLLVLAACQLPQKGDSTTNHLANETSPYLLQHAHNPVDWYPWGEEALEKAQAEDKLLLISIGYAACHWCHVMERESFSDTAIARFLNEHFVSIKVDREERPDIDKVYLRAAYLTTGQGGWPLNAIALPDGKPLFAATYFPPDQFQRLLEQFVSLRSQNPEELNRMGSQLAQGLKQGDQVDFAPAQGAFQPTQLDSAHEVLIDEVDFEYGGLKGAPKFPMPSVWRWLLQYHAQTGDPKALEAVQTTLDQLAQGGIFDHVGGGFARYSVDSVWKVPHFEKMLYDNAQLTTLYSEAYRATGDSLYRAVVYETLDFVAREMTDSLGGFYSSLNADSEGSEGRFYLWTEKDFYKTIGMDAKVMKDYFNVSPRGNWEGDDNVLYVNEPAAEVAARFSLSEGEFLEKLAVAKAQLREKRADRERPSLDYKVLSGWNALMLQGYAEAYRSFGEARFLEAALKNAHFLQENLITEEGQLSRTWTHGQLGGPAFADDYGYLIEALVSLYQATFDEQWLALADRLMQYSLTHFFDEKNQVFFYTATGSEVPLTRPRELADNVLPSSNASLARGLFLLGTYRYNQDYLAKSEALLRNVLAGVIEQAPNYTHWAGLLSWQAGTVYEVAIVGEDWRAKRAEWDQRYQPQCLLLGGEEEGELELLENKRVEGQTMIYVCQNKSCRLPVTEVEAARAQLAGMP